MADGGVPHYTVNFPRRPPILRERSWPWPGSHSARPQVVSVCVMFSCCPKCSSQSKRETEKERGLPKGTGPLIDQSLVRCPWDFIALKGFALFNYQVSDILWLLVKLSDTPWNTKSVAEDGCQDPSPRLENTSKARVMGSTLDNKSNRMGQSQGGMMVSFLSSVILGKLFKRCTLHLQNRGKITSSHPQRYCKDAMRSCLSHF